MIIYMDISQQLKRHRLSKGLSLAQLAQRADTSTATLSRYENGWQRFELYTLRKLAGALGCRLKVELVPIESAQYCADNRRAFQNLKRLFWDHKLRKKDLEDYPLWVIERVLEYGALSDVIYLVDLMGRKKFLERVTQVRFRSARTENFWLEMLKREGQPCTRSLSRKEARNYWPG
jgi:transcriptional regulator with XRE-family HTH domain